MSIKLFYCNVALTQHFKPIMQYFCIKSIYRITINNKNYFNINIKNHNMKYTL